ncbi:uncharacterized protein NPIL_27851 [Nephila pilipes]|uniref:Uncharacterized protein n=1 Tax=Nephila pilipes TaxID=299642 RepID=A0A8X6UTB3_NEPPI|nr:uncharacterized protein NPIL_27851 [Nephila pilipes]
MKTNFHLEPAVARPVASPIKQNAARGASDIEREGGRLTVLLRELPQQLVIGMTLNHFSILPLKSLSLVKVAILINNDAEIKALEEKYDLFQHVLKKKNTEGFRLGSQSYLVDLIGVIPFAEILLFKTFAFPPLREGFEISKSFYDVDSMDVIAYLHGLEQLTENDLFYAEWKSFVLKKISSLWIPKSLEKELLSFVRFIRLEIKEWMSNHREILRCFEEPTSFHWKSSGKINYEETAKSLIGNEKLDIRTRYALASFYYLKDDAIYLWSKERMSWGEKYLISHDHPSLEIWNSIVRRKSAIEWDKLADNRTGFDKDILGSSLPWYSHYHLGLQTLFPKLSRGKKIEWLRYSVKKETIDNEDLLFCLAHLETNDDKENLFREYPCQILGYFLDYPLQSQFLEVAESLWPFLSGRMYFFLLHSIIYQRILREWKDYNYFQLLDEFWNRSPIQLKECITSKNIYQVVMLALDFDKVSSFCNKDIVKRCKDIYFAFEILQTETVS